MKERVKILFLGASITQGKISVSFVNIIKKTLGTKQYKFINQGVAGLESYNILRNLNKAISSNPDFVIILGGTNDIISALDPKLSKVSRKLKKIPHDPTLSNFRHNVTQIIRQLKDQTRAKIAIASVPILGENLNSKENRIVKEYNSDIKVIAEAENVSYLPVFEKQENYLNQMINGNGKDCINLSGIAFKSLIQHYLLFLPLDSISKKNGYLLLTDGIHLNSTGSKFISNEIELFVRYFKK